MKRNRIILFLLWVLSLVGISFYGGPVSYGFFIMMTLLPLLSLLYLLAVRWRFSIYQKLEGKTFVADHAIPYFFTLQNEEWFAFASVRVFFYSDFSSVLDLADGEEYELLPGTGISRDTSLLCRYRGTYKVGIKSVEITDFLRLFRMRYKNPEPLEVTILPNVVTLSDLTNVNLTRILTRDLPFGNNVPDVSVRDYAAGDPRNRIHWTATAREQKLLVRRTTGEDQPSVAILLGTCRISDNPADHLPVENRMLEISLALARFFLGKRIPVRAYHCDAAFRAASVTDSAAFDAYYKVCSDLLFHASQSDRRLFAEAVKRPEILSARAAFFVLHEWSAEARETAAALNAGGVPVVVFLTSGRTDAADDGRALPRTEILPASPDEKLTEVM